MGVHTEQIRTDQGEDIYGSRPLLLTVVFTNVPETLAALRRAAVLADELGARIRIFLPYVVPYPLPIDCPHADPAFKIRQFRTLCEHEPIETRIEINLCRNAHECLMQELAPQSVLLIGDESGSRRSSSSRLAKSLDRRGHHVLLIRQQAQADAGGPTKWTWTWLLAGLVALILIMIR